MDVENRVERIFMEGQWLIGVDDFEFDPISLIKAGQVLSGVRNSCLIGINARDPPIVGDWPDTVRVRLSRWRLRECDARVEAQATK